MGLSTKVGAFNLDSTKVATDTQAITGVGFQPKVVLLWWAGSTNTVDECVGGNIMIGFGAAVSSSERRCSAITSLDGLGSSDSARKNTVDACIVVFNGSTASVDGVIDFVSMDSDGFTLVYDDAVTANFRINYLALGGTDLTNYKVNGFNSAASTGNQGVTGVGFQPSAVIFFQTAINNNLSANSQVSLGWATGSSSQGIMAWQSLDNQATMDTYSYGYNGECLARFTTSGSAINCRASFVSMDTDGFTINILEAQNVPWNYIALKGGQYFVGDLLTQTDTTTDISETTGFQPEAILFGSAARALSTQDTASAHSSFSLGSYDGTNQAAQASWDEDNTADSECAYAQDDGNVYVNISSSDAVQGLMKVISRSATGFICEMSDDADPSQNWVTYLAIGAAAVTAGILKHPGMSGHIESGRMHPGMSGGIDG